MEMRPLLQFRDMWIFFLPFLFFLAALESDSGTWHVVPSPLNKLLAFLHGS